jgi:hypothetical protein
MKVAVEDLKLTRALSLKGLPWGVVVPYIGTLPNGVTFAIFHPEKDWNYSDFRCVFGADDGTVREVAVKKVVRYRDGGTTDIETVVGSFHFPSPFNTEDKATFGGEAIHVEER